MIQIVTSRENMFKVVAVLLVLRGVILEPCEMALPSSVQGPIKVLMLAFLSCVWAWVSLHFRNFTSSRN